MAKSTIKKKGLSKHSRAARRATSPSIDTDKSLKEVKLPDLGINHRPAILAVHAGAGVSKKTSKRKSVLSSKARKRQEKAFDRAESVVEKMTLKVERSKSQARTVQSRRKDWDQINKSLPTTTMNAFQALTDLDSNDNTQPEDGLDDEMEEVGTEAPEQPAVPIAEKIASPVPAPAVDDLDEIL